MAKNKNKNKTPPKKKGGGNNTAKAKSTKKSHRVGLIKDSATEYGDLWLQVYLAPEGPVEAALLRVLLSRVGCMGVDNPSDADFVIFGGGSDVTPQLYGQTVIHEKTHTWLKRDLADLDLYQRCLEEGIPMVGICRGAQFGHVMNGGTLYQHVNNHVGDHAMFLPKENRIIPRISSSHHQMCKRNADMDIIGTTPGKSDIRYNTATLMESGKNNDIEAFFYSETCFFGVQGHPEYRGYSQYAAWFIKMIDELIVQNPDIEYRSKPKAYRLRQEMMDRRGLKNHRKIDATRKILEDLQAEKEKM